MAHKPDLKIGEVDIALAQRRLTLTIRRSDSEVVNRAAARSGCSVNIWLRGLIEARLADERAHERDQARIAHALDLQDPPMRRRSCSGGR